MMAKFSRLIVQAPVYTYRNTNATVPALGNKKPAYPSGLGRLLFPIESKHGVPDEISPGKASCSSYWRLRCTNSSSSSVNHQPIAKLRRC